MVESDRAALFALLNFVLNVGSAWACLCRISAMSLAVTRPSVRAGYSIALTLALASATMPLWGRQYYPGLGSIFSSMGLLILLWASRHAWDNGPPKHALINGHRTPHPKSSQGVWLKAAVIIPALIGLMMLFPIMEAALRGSVLREFKVTSVRIDGDDLWVEGTLVKWWDCEWRPPHRAYADGVPLGFASFSVDTNQQRPALRKPMAFGPWVITGGANKTVDIYTEHVCSFWSIVTHVGTINSRSIQE